MTPFIFPIPRRQILPPSHSIRLVLGLLPRVGLSTGPAITLFETAFAQYIGVRHAIGVASARTGLWWTLQMLGLKPGDEILCPAYTFHVLPELMRALGLRPIFIDADPEVFTLDPRLLEGALTPRSRAILVTHLFGQPCEMDPIIEFSKRHGLVLLEDCAHALGASYRHKAVGSFGRAGFFSFGPGKNLSCFGGGMVTTSDEHLAQRLRETLGEEHPPSSLGLLRELIKTLGLAWGTGPHGFRWMGYPTLRLCEAVFPGLVDRLMEEPPGPKGALGSRATRLSNLQAAVGLDQIPLLEERNRRTLWNAQYLMGSLGDLPGLKFQRGLPEAESTALYCRVLVPEREAFRRELLRLGLDTKRDDMSNGGGSAFPVAARLVQQSLELPNGPGLHEAELRQIVDAVRRVALQRQPKMMRVRPEIPAPTSTLSGR